MTFAFALTLVLMSFGKEVREPRNPFTHTHPIVGYYYKNSFYSLTAPLSSFRLIRKKGEVVDGWQGEPKTNLWKAEKENGKGWNNQKFTIREGPGSINTTALVEQRGSPLA